MNEQNQFQVAPGAQPLDPQAIQQQDGPEVGKHVDLRQSPEEVAEEKKEEEKQEEQAARVTVCPACGTDLRFTQEREVSDEEKERWLRHILGEERFTKDYDLFGGRVQVVFRSCLAAENDSVTNQIQTDVDTGEISSGPLSGPIITYRTQCYFLALYLQSIYRVGGKEPSGATYKVVNATNYPPEGDDDKREPVKRAYEKIIRGSDMPEGLLNSLICCMKDFDVLTGTLLQHSNDPDFWSPVGTRT
jgi:hypothetical protein